MKDRPSDIARQILEYGLKADTRLTLDIPVDYRNLAAEVYDVPERPEGFAPNFNELEHGNTIVLTSGGLDSTIAYLMTYEQLGRAPDAFYVNMGQPYAMKEMKALDSMGITYEYVEVEPPEHIADGKWKHIHPGRNFYYLSLVAERAKQPSNLVLSAVDGEISAQGGDKSKVFFREANRIFAQLDNPVKVVTPLAEMTKTDLVKWAIDHGWSKVASMTISCFNAEEGRCGQCQSCLRTWIAFHNNGIELPFKVHPMEGAVEAVAKYERVMNEAMQKGDYSHYSPRRIAQTLAAFQGYRQKRLL